MSADVPTPRKISVSEYHRMVDAGILSEDDRVELINGVIIEMPPIGITHACTTDFLTELLVLACHDKARVRVANPLALGDFSEPQPDFAVYSLNHDARQGHPGPDSSLLVVEVAASSLTHDRDRKVPLYARWGIPRVWLVDVDNRILTVYAHPVEGDYRQVTRFEKADIDEQRFEIMSGLSVSLNGLFY